MKEPSPGNDRFDATDYWRSRHRNLTGLEATGTLGASLKWQQWLYRGKVREYVRALNAAGISLQGARVFDFGCGTGFFEGEWESRGASQVAGIDVVDQVIGQLQHGYPNRTYVCGDLSKNPALLDGLGTFDLVTAIDVLYHIVDDASVHATLRSLVRRVDAQGLLLLTDALTNRTPAPHVKFRSLEFWNDCMQKLGMEQAYKAPVFLFQNRPALWRDSLLTSAAAWLTMPTA